MSCGPQLVLANSDLSRLSGINPNAYSCCHQLNTQYPNGDIRLDIDGLDCVTFGQISGLSRDLMDIAFYVYSADKRIRRSTNADIYAARWIREITMVMSVREMAVWQDQAVRSALEELLGFLTGDRWTLVFTTLPDMSYRPILEFTGGKSFPGADSVCLFSGGMDSATGAIDAVLGSKLKPVLIGHRAAPVIGRRQRVLINAIRDKYSQVWGFPFVSVRSTQRGESVERTQRSRSFLYLALAVALAEGLELETVLCPENGIVSINLPLVGQISTMATRTTHPKTIALLRSLLERIYSKPPRLINPFALKTKGDLAEMMKGYDCSDIAVASTSCARTTFRTKDKPHCGICTQCIERRFAFAYAGLEDEEPVQSYEVDIFTEALREGEARGNAEGYLRLITSLRSMTASDFYAKYRIAMLAVDEMDMEPRTAERKLFEMVKSNANQSLQALATKSKGHMRDMQLGQIPSSSVLGMARYGLR